jgi:glycosyltransferase involved in cell wall biosynthesis
MNKIDSLSIIFPIYNDKENVKYVIVKSIELLKNLNIPSEIIIINDGCPYGSGAEAEKWALKHDKIKIINHDFNKGYGEAIKTGLKNSRYDWILQTDGDNQYDINDYYKMIKIIHNYDCIITFRYQKIYANYRIFISWLYNIIVRFHFNTKFRDISTGLRLIKREAIKDINFISNSSFIGAEIAIKLHLNGYQVGELGINTYPRKFGKSSIITLKSIFLTIKDLLKVKKNLFS